MKKSIRVLIVAIMFVITVFVFCGCQWIVTVNEPEAKGALPTITLEKQDSNFTIKIYNKNTDYTYDNIGKTDYVYIDYIKVKDSVNFDTIREFTWTIDGHELRHSDNVEDIDLYYKTDEDIRNVENNYVEISNLTKFEVMTLTVRRTDTLKDDVYTLTSSEIIEAIKKKFS